jgi:heme-degrading monooxygenase HmoA
MGRLPGVGETVVIFRSVRRDDDDEGYAVMAERMEELASRQPGFISVDSVRDSSTGVGITTSYWADEASARAWKAVAEHREAQARGRSEWYSSCTVVVAQVTRSYVSDTDGALSLLQP